MLKFNLKFIIDQCYLSNKHAHLSALDTVLHSAHLDFFVCTPEILSKTAILPILGAFHVKRTSEIHQMF